MMTNWKNPSSWLCLAYETKTAVSGPITHTHTLAHKRTHTDAIINSLLYLHPSPSFYLPIDTHDECETSLFIVSRVLAVLDC